MFFLKKAVIILLGSLLLSIGINLFLVPYEVLDGGIIGIGLISSYIWGFQAGLVIIFVSIPIFLIAWYHYRNYFYNSLHGMLVSSFFIDLLKPLAHLLELPEIFSAVTGGTLIGIGIGIMLRYRTSTGGTDLLAQFISEKTGWNVGLLIFSIDAIIIISGGIFISTETIFLSVIAILFVGIATSCITRKVKPVT
ncbi:YitT family protein [Sediminibacillus massiliensis]|uniref:YitT family protein n=1 Tax=Sediminibacillus massiliensis TaxID=1926277 RepID=UPI0009885F6C|nr:YitT family protein [Sediminibacillus massiliensis]